MDYASRKALVKSYLGKVVDIKIDRPLGSVHPKHQNIVYPINYGYIPEVFGGDGEELDVYLLGVSVPLNEYRAKVIGIVHRHNDEEDKLVATPEGCVYYQNEIAEAVHFQEQYYETHIESLYEKSSGAVVYTIAEGEILYLLIKQENGDIGFPKGHLEIGETEEQAALREIFEETSIKSNIVGDFRCEISYTMPNGKNKTAVYFTAEFRDQAPKHNDGYENNEYIVCSFNDALKIITFDDLKDILIKANEYLEKRKYR